MARHNDAPDGRAEIGALQARISEAVVRLLAQRTGRGPTTARTTISGDLVVVVLQDSLTAGELFLAGHDHAEQVLATRRVYQESMRSEYIAAVEALTQRRVAAFMSANHIDPDLAAEVFVLEPQHDPTA